MRTLLCTLLIASSSLAQNPFPATSANNASEYWFDKAEITRYELTQSRYGEIRTGHSVLIFVTEPFLPEKQVKHEYGEDLDSIPVLKLNRIRSFTTGIYDYRLMASVFHPMEDVGPEPSGLKIAMSATEWCGLVFQQINRRDDTLQSELRSYFQNEGDQNGTLPNVWTEDELWLRIRIAPNTLPTGEFQALPELFYQRLAHLQPSTMSAIGSISTNESGATSRYTLYYPALDRTLTISYETQYPHRIFGWKETVQGKMFSRGKSTHTERLYYWQLNQNEDLPYREKLGIPGS